MHESTSVSSVLDFLADAARRYRYDDVCSSKPPLDGGWVAEVKDGAKEPMSSAVLEQGLTSFFKSMVSRGWNESHTVWLSRKVDGRPFEHADEIGFHPQLVGIEVPRLIVEHFLTVAKDELTEAQVLAADDDVAIDTTADVPRG